MIDATVASLAAPPPPTPALTLEDPIRGGYEMVSRL